MKIKISKKIVKKFSMVLLVILSACNSGNTTSSENNKPVAAKDELAGSMAYKVGQDMPVYTQSASNGSGSTPTQLDIRGFNSVTGNFSSQYCYKATAAAGVFEGVTVGNNTISLLNMDTKNVLDYKWEAEMDAHIDELGAGIKPVFSAKYMSTSTNILDSESFYMYSSYTVGRTVYLSYSTESAPGNNGGPTTWNGLSSEGNGIFNILTNSGANITPAIIKEFYRQCGDILPQTLKESAWLIDVTQLDSVHGENFFELKRDFNLNLSADLKNFLTDTKATGTYESKVELELTTKFAQNTFSISGYQKGGSPTSITPYNADCTLNADSGLSGCQGLANQWSSAENQFSNFFNGGTSSFYDSSGQKLYFTMSMGNTISAATAVPVGGDINSTYVAADNVLAARKTIYTMLGYINDYLEELYALMDQSEYQPSQMERVAIKDNIIRPIVALRETLSVSSLKSSCYIADTKALASPTSPASKECVTVANTAQTSFANIQSQISVLKSMIRALSFDLNVQQINDSQQPKGQLFDFYPRYSSLASSGKLQEFQIYGASYETFSSKKANPAASALTCVPDIDSTFKNLSYLNVVHQYSCPTSGSCDVSIVGDCVYQTQNGLQPSVKGKFNLSFDIGSGGNTQSSNNEMLSFYGSYTTIVNGNLQYTPVVVTIQKTPSPKNFTNNFPLSKNPLGSFGSAGASCPTMLYQTYSQILFGICQNQNGTYNASTLSIPSNADGPSDNNGMLY